MKLKFNQLFGYTFFLLLNFIPILHVSGQTGIVKGRVFNASNNEALPFVNVVVSGTTTGASTDVDGNFVITGLKPGFIQLTAKFIGFQPAVTGDIQINNAKAAFIEIGMQEATQNIEEVKVTASAFRKTEESPLSLRTISLAEIENSPGANRDISKVIQSFPGIGGGLSYRNDVIVRGGGPSESRFYLEDVEIPIINHFATQGSSGGSVGIINADFVREVNYFSGAFPSDKGNALSGVFDFKLIDANKDKMKFRGSLGASEMSATFDGPLSNNTGLVFSVRRSYLQLLFQALGLPFLPTFNDLQFKTRTKINKKNEITFLGLGAIDKSVLNLDIKNPDEKQRYILGYLPSYEQWNYTVGAVYKHYMAHGYQTFVLSRTHLNNISYKYMDNDESKPKSIDYSSQEIENKLRYEINSRRGAWKWSYGANMDFARYTNESKLFRVVGNSSTPLNISYETEMNLVKYGLFGQVSRNLDNDRLVLSLGMRTDANNYSSSMQNMLDQFSPRFSASYAFNPKFSFNFNTGRYFQLPAYTSLGYRQNGELINKNNNLKYIAVNHLIGGFEFRPNRNSQITIEGFAKMYDHYPYSVADGISLANKGDDYGAVGDEAVTSTSKGKAVGAEFLYRLKTDKGLVMNLAYTYVRSEFKSPGGNYIPSTWDSKHLLTLTASRPFGKNWNAGLRWRFVGGLPYTPYDLEKSALKAIWDVQNQAVSDYSRLNDARLDAFHQLDLRIDKAYYFSKWTLKLYFDIQNAYNFQSSQPDMILRTENADGSYQTVNEGGVEKYVLRGVKNTSGTVLPTIGVQFEF
jgi:hypothetical protein